MEFIYLKKFAKTSVDDMEAVQEVVKVAGGLIDAALFPLIDAAEQGDYGAMAELWEMFVRGTNKVKPNYNLAMRYWSRLQQHNLKTEDPVVISEGLNNYAYLHHDFDKMEEATQAFIEAFRYMVTHLEPKDWDKQVIQLVAENIDVYQNQTF